MEEQIKLRIKSYLTIKGLTINKIAKESGYPQSNLQKQVNEKVTLSVKTLLAILSVCDDLSAEWLLRGKGSMFVSENTGKTYNITKQGGNGSGQVNIVGDGNEVDREGLLKMALEQNQQLINALLGGK